MSKKEKMSLNPEEMEQICLEIMDVMARKSMEKLGSESVNMLDMSQMWAGIGFELMCRFAEINESKAVDLYIEYMKVLFDNAVKNVREGGVK